MGNCLNVDVESKYAVGDVNVAESVSSASDAEEATALLSGSLAYSTWIDLSLKCANLAHADILRCALIGREWLSTVAAFTPPSHPAVSQTLWPSSISCETALGLNSGGLR